MSTTATNGRDALDRRTTREIERFLRTRQLALGQLIRRGFDERQAPAGEDSDQVAAASRTLDAEVRATLVDRASRELAEGRTVRLELDARERDAEGRLLAYVHVGDTMLNAELVRRGHALVVAMPPNVRHDVRLLGLQREARATRRGVWAPAGQSR